VEKLIKVQCAYCGNYVNKPLKEYRRRRKKNPKVKFFCGLSCARYQQNKYNPPKGNVKNLRPSQTDQYSPFRRFVLSAKSRSKVKKYDCDITVIYLKELWEEQGGICPFTGWKLILPIKTSKPYNESKPENASLDRIDNSKGYIKGNVRFVAFMANLCRQAFTDIELIRFCKDVFNKLPKDYNTSSIQLERQKFLNGKRKNIRTDQYTPFRYFVLLAKKRNKKRHYGFNITAEYLKKIWDEQNGICPFTSCKLILPIGTDKAFVHSEPGNASLDRIDGSKGYIEGNVRFVAYMANLGRQAFTDIQFINFCKAVAININKI